MSHKPSLLKDSVLRAGAGAGKTTALTEHILDFATYFKNQSGRFPRIIVSTFTNKATQELKERLLFLAQKSDDKLLVKYISQASQVHISTIHGVFALFLNRYGHRLNLDPSFNLIGHRDWYYVCKKVLKSIIRSDKYSSLIEVYDLKTLVSMLQEYYFHKNEKSNLSRWSLKEIKSELIKADQELSNKLKICSSLVHTVEDKKWAEYADFYNKVIDSLANKNILAMRDELSSFRRPSSKKAKDFLSDKDLHFIEDCFDEVKKRCFDLSFSDLAIENHEKLSLLFGDLANEFCIELDKYKEQNGHYNISDLEHISLNAVRNHPDLAHSFSQEWDYWLIDEYQDTSPVQEEILEALIQDRSRFLVGDPQQSIYLFRGARFEIFSEREAKMRAKGADSKLLNNNYRSSPELVSFFNELFCKLNHYFTPMVAQVESNKKWKDENIKLAVFDNTEDEKLAIYEHVLELRKKGEDWESICILGRTNNSLDEIARFLISKDVPVFVHASGGFNRRREILDILSVYRFLHAPYDNENLIRLLRCPVLNIPDATLVEWAQSSKGAEYWSQFYKYSQNSQQRVVFETLNRFLESVKERGLNHALLDCLKEIKYIEHLNLIDTTGQAEANIWKFLFILQNAEQEAGFNPANFYRTFMDSSSDYAQESDAIAALEPKRLNLMTIHRSKGLQFSHVIIPNLEKQVQTSKASSLMVDEKSGKWSVKIKNDDDEKYYSLFITNNILKILKQRELDESERVLYVAMTRAKNTVLLTSGGKAKKGSWLERWPLELDEGRHEKTDFVLNVIKKNRNIEFDIKEERLDINARKPWREKQAVDGVTSVTGMLSDRVMNTQSILGMFRSASRGQMFHRIIEAIQKQPLLDWGQLVNEWFPNEAKEVSKALLYVMQLKEIPMFKILSEGRAEWGFVHNVNGQRLEGQVDLWAIVDGEVWIIDYKTGSSDWSHKAFKQLGVYSVPVRKFAKIENANLVALYPFEEKYFHKKADSIDVLTSEIQAIMKEV